MSGKGQSPSQGVPETPFSSGEVRSAIIGAPTSFGSVSRPAHAPGSPRCGSEWGEAKNSVDEFFDYRGRTEALGDVNGCFFIPC